MIWNLALGAFILLFIFSAIAALFRRSPQDRDNRPIHPKTTTNPSFDRPNGQPQQYACHQRTIGLAVF